MFVTNYKKDNK